MCSNVAQPKRQQILLRDSQVPATQQYHIGPVRDDLDSINNTWARKTFITRAVNDRVSEYRNLQHYITPGQHSPNSQDPIASSPPPRSCRWPATAQRSRCITIITTIFYQNWSKIGYRSTTFYLLSFRKKNHGENWLLEHNREKTPWTICLKINIS